MPSGWVKAKKFESLLQEFRYLVSPVRVSFEFPDDCMLMFDCIGLLLSISNQFAEDHIPVVLAFTSANSSALSYLDRAGFFQHLHQDVAVSPGRPEQSAADRYRGRSETLEEIAALSVCKDDKIVALRLKEKFVRISSSDYEVAAATLFGELVGNVGEHSQAKRGFAGLQKYEGKTPQIQTIVSDGGVGIARTLRSSLREHHSDLYRLFGHESPESNIELVRAAIEKGGISRFGKERGLGLHQCHSSSKRFRARFSIRQDLFALRYAYENGQLDMKEIAKDLYPMRGTQVCFYYELG